MTALTEAELARQIAREAIGYTAIPENSIAWWCVVRAAKIALARQALAVQWQPIATAPKDGTDILIWSQEAGWHARVKWWNKKSGPQWVCSYTHKRHLCKPSHWMPLPPPPAPAESGARKASERKDDDAAIRQQIDMDRGSERRGNERLHPGDTGGSDTVAVSTDVRPVAPAPSEGKDDGQHEPLRGRCAGGDNGSVLRGDLADSIAPDIDGVVERLRAHFWTFDDPLADDAADLLIAMRDELDFVKQENQANAAAYCETEAELTKVRDQLTASRAEIERLREALIEERAKLIYERMDYDGPVGSIKPRWVERGNSDKQNEARREARAALKKGEGVIGMKKNAAYWQNMAEFGVSVQKDLVADLTAARQEAERLRELVNEASAIIYRLEKEHAIEHLMYDGRPVEAWCDKAKQALTHQGSS